MTFKEIQDAVLSDRFAERQRGDIKQWVNSRYGRLWAAEAWSFKVDTEPVVIPAGDNSASLGSFQRLFGIWRGTSAVPAIRPEDFYEGTVEAAGFPSGMTVVGGRIILDRKAEQDTTFTVLGEKRWTPMSADGEEPLIPEEFHFMLVHGAASEGLRLQNDPTWQGFEQDWIANVQDMKSAYLTPMRTFGDSFPAWP
jgi:hypothetical protein